MNEIPMIKINNGTQAQAMAITAPVISDALGTNPMRRITGDVVVVAVSGSTSRSMTATTPSTYGTAAAVPMPFTAQFDGG
jgi:hypothetical protein